MNSHILYQNELNENIQPTMLQQMKLSRNNSNTSLTNATTFAKPPDGQVAASLASCPERTARSEVQGSVVVSEEEVDEQGVYTAPSIRIPRPKGGRYRPLAYGSYVRRTGSKDSPCRARCSLSLLDALVEDPAAEGAELYDCLHTEPLGGATEKP